MQSLSILRGSPQQPHVDRGTDGCRDPKISKHLRGELLLLGELAIRDAHMHGLHDNAICTRLLQNPRTRVDICSQKEKDTVSIPS